MGLYYDRGTEQKRQLNVGHASLKQRRTLFSDHVPYPQVLRGQCRWWVVAVELAVEGVGDTKELVHLLERQALSFGDEEVDKDAHEEAKAAKHEIHAVPGAAHGALHGEHGSSGNEVEEPLSGSGDGDVEGTQAGGGNFADEDPACRAPAELKRCRPQVNAGDGNVAKGGNGLTFDRGLHAAVDADDEEDDTLRAGGGDEAPPTAERIGDEEQEEGAADDLDDAIDAGGKQRRVGGVHAQIGKDSTQISGFLDMVAWWTYNGIDAGELLADHEHDGDEGAVAVAGDEEHFAKESLGRAAAGQAPLNLELVGHFLYLSLHVGVRGGQVSESRECRGGLFPVVLLGEPAGGFGREGHADDEENGRERLEGERDDILGGGGDVEKTAIIDPAREGDHDAKHVKELVKPREAATDRARGALGDVNGGEGRRGATPEPGDEAADVHDSKRPAGGRRSLQDDADGGERAGRDEDPTSAEAVRGPAGDEAGEEAARLEGRDNVLLQVGLVLGGAVEEAEAGLGGRHVQDAANGARVPAKEHAAEAGGADEGEDPAVVDGRRVLAHGVVAHNGAEKPGNGAGHD
ncbi:hypothetical protein CCM_07161 [Cordyceps militaris CM01]|uniref:Uncharacterized protein n=1 Tax=Cordyceps militaris (strain CM01) TaxID=983644 RepID=G3JM17_CORMM|nr:uncharacterized protein CCM_07161 [Cordyceps militaris CM01]EGX90741.1 hypothetical protein CCM_07161 [Cordyceps militaris CM01]